MSKEEAQNSNSTLIMCHYPGLDSTSDWLCHKEKLLPPIRTTTATQIRAVRRHQNEISALIPHMLIRRETRGGITRCWQMALL